MAHLLLQHQTACGRWLPALAMRPGLAPHMSVRSLAASMACILYVLASRCFSNGPECLLHLLLHHQTACGRWPPALSMRPGLAPQVSVHSLAASKASAPVNPPLYSTLMVVSGSERTSLKASLHA